MITGTPDLIIAELKIPSVKNLRGFSSRDNRYRDIPIIVITKSPDVVECASATMGRDAVLSVGTCAGVGAEATVNATMGPAMDVVHTPGD